MELRRENERLREALTETTLRLAQLKVELERATQVQILRPKNQLLGAVGVRAPVTRGLAVAGRLEVPHPGRGGRTLMS